MTAAVNVRGFGWFVGNTLHLCAQQSRDTYIAGTGYQRDLVPRAKGISFPGPTDTNSNLARE